MDTKGPSDKDQDILSTARDRMGIALAAYSDTRSDELDDLRFYGASSDNKWQWPDDVLATRGAVQGQTINARPCLTINKLPQHVRQITNDQRQNRPSGKVIPVNSEADVEIAEIYDGMVRHIEYISDADVAYDTACENQVSFGEGYFRILTDYCNENTFDQDIKIGRIRSSFSVYMDPMIQDPCGADAKWCLITDDIPKKEYERLYPNAAPVSSLMSLGVGDQAVSQWVTENTVRIAEYFYYDHRKKILNLYPGGLTAYVGTGQDKAAMGLYGKPLKSREVNIPQVKWCKINGYEILEAQDWAGKYIPVIRVIGNELVVEGRMYISGIVRNAKDPQRMYNYWVSQEAEMLALAPKAPFIGYGGQFEGYEDKWKTANVNNWPYLEVNADVTDGQGRVLPLPQRAAPPLAQTGLIQAKMGASDDIKAATGQYDSSLGQTSNERSGKAILARERQVDTGTYHYVDNLARAIRYGTRQLVDLIPKIYDTARIARIIGEDGDSKMVQLNPSQPEAVKKMDNGDGTISKIYNIGVGEYDVCVTTGPSYMTKRQEALEGMTTTLQTVPDLWKVFGDLVVKNMDWPGAQEISKRLAKTIDPKLLQGEDESPEMQSAQQQLQVLAQENEQMHQMLKDVPKSIEVQEQKRLDDETRIKAFSAETDRIKVLQASMSPDQIQEIVLGTVHGMMASSDLAMPDVSMTPDMPVGQGIPPQGMSPQ